LGGRKERQKDYREKETTYVVEGLTYSWSLPELENIIIETLASQRTVSSLAFLNKPFLLFEYVTCLFVAFSILLIWIFPLAISSSLSVPSFSFLSSLGCEK
jgi:hypothetical protein